MSRNKIAIYCSSHSLSHDIVWYMTMAGTKCRESNAVNVQSFHKSEAFVNGILDNKAVTLNVIEHRMLDVHIEGVRHCLGFNRDGVENILLQEVSCRCHNNTAEVGRYFLPSVYFNCVATF